jgi:hypothetical protein
MQLFQSRDSRRRCAAIGAPPVNQPWAFGRLDHQHLVLIVGTGPNEPVTIRSVNAWQAAASNNLHQ